MIYGYVRVSTDKQSTENQRFEIENYSKAKGFRIETLGRRNNQRNNKCIGSPTWQIIKTNS